MDRAERALNKMKKVEQENEMKIFSSPSCPPPSAPIPSWWWWFLCVVKLKSVFFCVERSRRMRKTMIFHFHGKLLYCRAVESSVNSPVRVVDIPPENFKAPATSLICVWSTKIDHINLINIHPWRGLYIHCTMTNGIRTMILVCVLLPSFCSSHDEHFTISSTRCQEYCDSCKQNPIFAFSCQ